MGDIEYLGFGGRYSPNVLFYIGYRTFFKNCKIAPGGGLGVFFVEFRSPGGGPAPPRGVRVIFWGGGRTHLEDPVNSGGSPRVAKGATFFFREAI